jgi:uncharacterized protein (UPF0248 family)
VGTVRDLLNRLRWDPSARPDRVVLEVRVREAGEESLDEVRFQEVSEILPGGVAVADGTFLPYHRVMAVRRNGEVLWRRGRR